MHVCVCVSVRIKSHHWTIVSALGSYYNYFINSRTFTLQLGKEYTVKISTIAISRTNTIQYNTTQICIAPLVASESEALGDSV